MKKQQQRTNGKVHLEAVGGMGRASATNSPSPQPKGFALEVIAPDCSAKEPVCAETSVAFYQRMVSEIWGEGAK